MLSVLRFKQSLFAGVLDGGEKEAFLGGSRLTKFMETVEKTTAAIGPPTAQVEQRDPEGERVIPPGREESETTIRQPSTGQTVTADPWTGLVQTDLAFLEQLVAAARSPRDGGRAGLSLVQRDPLTGRDYLRIPLPDSEVLERALQTIGSLLERSRPKA